MRLFICTIAYTFFIGASLLSRIMTQYFELFKMNKIVIEDYVQPLWYNIKYNNYNNFFFQIH